MRGPGSTRAGVRPVVTRDCSARKCVVVHLLWHGVVGRHPGVVATQPSVWVMRLGRKCRRQAWWYLHPAILHRETATKSANFVEWTPPMTSTAEIVPRLMCRRHGALLVLLRLARRLLGHPLTLDAAAAPRATASCSAARGGGATMHGRRVVVHTWRWRRRNAARCRCRIGRWRVTMGASCPSDGDHHTRAVAVVAVPVGAGAAHNRETIAGATP